MKLSWTWQKVSVPATNMVLQLFNLFKIFSSLLPDFSHLVLFLNLKNWYASWTNLSSSFTWRLRKVSLLVDQSDNFDGWLISRMNLRKVRLLDGQSDIFFRWLVGQLDNFVRHWLWRSPTLHPPSPSQPFLVFWMTCNEKHQTFMVSGFGIHSWYHKFEVFMALSIAFSPCCIVFLKYDKQHNWLISSTPPQCDRILLFFSPPGRLLPPHQLQVCLPSLLNMVDCPSNLEANNLMQKSTWGKYLVESPGWQLVWK